MGKFGGVSYRAVKQAESETIDMELLTPSQQQQLKLQEQKKIDINIPQRTVPLAQLSISSRMTKEEEFSLKRPSWDMATSMIRSLIPYYWSKNSWSIKLRVLVSLSIIFISKFINLWVPLLFKNIINELPNTVPWHWLVLYGVLSLIQKSIWDFRDIIFQSVTDSATKNINLETFDHLHSMSLSYHLSKRTGSLIKIVERGSNAVVHLLSLLLFNIFPTLVEILLVSFFLLFSYGYTFAFINLFSCIIYITFTLSVTEWRTQYRRLANKKENEASDIKVDSFSNFETVKYFTAESYERKRYDNAILEYFRVNMKSKITFFTLNFGQSIIIVLGSTIGLAFATWRATKGVFTIGDIVAINTFIAQIFSPLSWLGSSYRMILQSFTDMENLMDLLRTKSDVYDQPGAAELDLVDRKNPGHHILPSIEFNNVSFSYKTKTATVKILDGVSFRVEPGKSVALVGPTGAGKSTVFRLLCRFYDVDDGEVLVENQNIKNITQLSLRQAIGVVPQDTVLFNDTIAYNIGFGKREATDEELIDAARRAQILPFIESSPDGFLTLVGERGLRLSGGEKQRVAIARTLLKNPPILILDEATSALDSLTEKKIQQSLNEVSKGRTTLIIAHRLSTIIHCDEILVLKNGIIAERGTHNQLLSIQGEYANLWNQQLKSPDNIPQA
ncbi:ABC transporter B family protein [Tieghemostelium lacteum]|uniref:ABC transporter B family protein n=1 Tax=Tieghemostelium lacteum TaxID=361077 RepID=A0A151ZHL2_TIELA|nr:ABC transporter B family protein [Tieghemostelium lacteum]|eukprot:KYQ93456.1 ABC transporter B family protein [Tieghemostelium lacteum]